MKNWLLIINILTLLGLTACQPVKEKVVEKHYVNENGTGLPVPPSHNEGGIDGGGGGNGLDGKPLESFRVDLNQQAAYLRVKTQVIDKLVTRFPKLAADILHISEERAWYLIPTELRNLPAARIGVGFRTDQIALQKLKEVWINDLLFAKMEPRQQETLILHELIMGVRLLEFTNLLDQCLAGISSMRLSNGDITKYKEARRACFKKYRNASDVGDSIGLGKDIRLEDYDYETIRDITSTLMTKVDSFDAQELEDYMAARGFRVYEQP
ncbi:hypothetical protein [Bdellovibrio sp. HCB337]|uniref:hypothetical protein n=1 Tax=Bdellovibrio sp. HCB337 TaxID=3394358 RepID=UPI0039A4CF32